MIPIVNGVASRIEHTSNNTPKLIKRVEVPAGTTVTIYGIVVTGQNNAAAQNIFVQTQQMLVYNNSTGLLPVLTASIAPVTTDPLALGYTVTLTPNGQYVDVYVTGANGHEVDWNCWVERVEMATNVFTPAAIAGLLLWFRGDLLVTLNGSRVSSWGNLADTAFLASIDQATAGDQPLLVASGINGLPAVDFSFARPDFLRGTFASNLAQPGDIFFVQRPNSIRVSYLVDSAGSANRWQIVQEGDATFDLNANANINGGASSVGVAEVFEGKVNGVSGEILVNGVSVAAGNVGANTWDGMTLGAAKNDALGADTRIGEFLMWPTILSAGDRAKVMAYLRAEWGTP